MQDAASTGRIYPLVVELAALTVLFLLVDALVLKFIFPGYFDPFWPHHSDYYIAPALAFSPKRFLATLTYPRPVGSAIYWLSGHLKTRGAIAVLLLFVAANFAMITTIIRRSLGMRADWKFILAAAVFAYMIASHPYQYQFSTWDGQAQISLAFILAATLMYMRGTSSWVCAVVLLLGFLSKETYIASALFCACAWAATQKTERRSYAPIIAVAISAFIALTIEHFLSSPFTSGSLGASDPYFINLAPTSVAHLWSRYILDGMTTASSAAVLLAILAIVIARGIRDAASMWAICLPIAGMLALLPNSILPNHYYEGYSFNAAYLMFAPLLVMASTFTLSAKSRVLTVCVAVAAITSPIQSRAAFSKQDWIVTNQKRQKLFLQTLGGLMRQIPRNGETILITGVSFPYSPFEYTSSLGSISKPADTRLISVAYDQHYQVPFTKMLNANEPTVSMIEESDTGSVRFDEAWLFRPDGSLVRKITSTSDLPSRSGGFPSPTDFLKWPELLDSLGDGAPHKNDGYGDLQCGISLINYHAYAEADQCLSRARATLANNPYPFYWSGVAFEAIGKTEEAKRAYSSAIALQANSPNPAFQQALNRIK